MSVRVTLVGCGFHADRAHLPALSAARDRASLTHVVELAGSKDEAERRLAAHGLEAAEVVTLPDGAGTEVEELHARLNAAIGEVEGVIISTPPAERLGYLHWALDRGARALCDKPVAVRPFASVDEAAARRVWSDFDAVRRRAPAAAVIVGTQRRYHPFYLRMARTIREVHAATGEAINFVQALTNDGLRLRDYAACALFDPAQSGGGKLINTGYHLLDLIPWLMRHAPAGRPIVEAEVHATAVRAGDASTRREALAGGGNEINAALQVSFNDDRGHVVCQTQIGALHAGMSIRAMADPEVEELDDAADWLGAATSRAKQEMLSLYQGRAAAVFARRLTGALPGHGSAIGQRGHADLTTARSPDAGGQPLETIARTYRDDEGAPTRELLDLLTSRTPGPSRSPLEDHAIPTRLLSATYCALVTGAAQRITFEPEAWGVPPGAGALAAQ